MNPLPQRWAELSARFGARSQRERVIVLLAVVVGTAAIHDAVVLTPLVNARLGTQRQIEETRKAIGAGDLALRSQTVATDPDAVRRSYRDALRTQLEEIDASMQALQKQLVPPSEVPRLLEGLLGRSSGLKLISLRKLPVQRFDTAALKTPTAAPGSAPANAAKPKPAAGAGAQQPERAIYQHSFELTVQGGYVNLHDYVARLEKLPWQMFWASAQLHAEDHPQLRLTLVVHTLSLNASWLIV